MTYKDRFIASLLRLGLLAVRGLVWLKPRLINVISWVLLPSRVLWAILLSVAIPVYRLIYSFKRRAGDIYRPAKSRLMYFVANRYTVHVMTVLVLFVAFGFNLRASTVRAETFGEDTLMYTLIVNQGERFIEEEIVLESVANRAPTNYVDGIGLATVTYGLRPEGSLDGSMFASSSGLNARQTLLASDSVAPREETLVYTVGEGDTLSDVANRFGISLNTLLWANDLSARSSIRPGRELKILPVSGVVHTVARGDTAIKIATRYGAKTDEMLAFNNLGANDSLTVGMQLVVPGGEIKAVAAAPSSVGRVFAAPSTPVARPSTPVGTGAGTGSMIWPTDLRIITQYFKWNHTGVDIDCHFTHNNYAAEAGTVIFSGWKGGYGYTVEVDHGGGMITRYAHHARLYVSSGQQVARGEAVGLCGTTGRSTGTHLHFEVIINGKFQNPLQYVR